MDITTDSNSGNIFRYRSTVVACLAGLICILAYLRSLSCDFVNWDDPAYVVMNPAIRVFDWTFVTEAFATSYMGWWMPLTWISLAVDYQIWGLNPLGYHLTNILLHAVNTGLVVLIADRILVQGQWTGFQSLGFTDDKHHALKVGAYLSPATLLLSGLLWGLHPLRVESVAWVSERKDVLNGLFSLTTILFYLRYQHVRKLSGQRTATISIYLLSFFFFLLSIMTKPVSVVIPLMLLVLDWFPFGRLRKNTVSAVIIEKIPFIFVSVAIALATIYFASSQTILMSFQYLPLYKRLILAGNAVMEYCWMSLFPVGLANLYLLPKVFPAKFYFNAIASMTITCYCIVNWRKTPRFFATWMLFLLPLTPVLGIFQNGDQSHADRFTYLPTVFPSIAAAVVIAMVYKQLVAFRSMLHVRMFVVGILTVLVFFAGMTQQLIGTWKNSETLWTRLITVKPVGRAYYYRGDYYMEIGKYREAADDFLVSIQMAKNAGNLEVYDLYALRGYALNKAGYYEEAVRDFTEAIEGQPLPNYFYHRGRSLKAIGRDAEAEIDFSRAGNNTGPLKWKF